MTVSLRKKMIEQLQELAAIADCGIIGERGAVNNGWGVLEHVGYAAALRDVINVIETTTED